MTFNCRKLHCVNETLQKPPYSLRIIMNLPLEITPFMAIMENFTKKFQFFSNNF